MKAVFPIAARASEATYETMFGAVERPTHANTDADLARYEVPGHRWADLAEPGFGVSLLSDARYGFSVFGDQMALSLVRGAIGPTRWPTWASTASPTRSFRTPATGARPGPWPRRRASTGR